MKGRFKNSKTILATDKVPDSIFGYPVVSKDADYTEADVGFFREHPEAGGYYDLEDSEEPDAQAAEKGGRTGEPGDEPTWKDGGGYTRPYRRRWSQRWNPDTGKNEDVFHYYGAADSRPLTEEEYNAQWWLNTERRRRPGSSTKYERQPDGTYRHPRFGDAVIYQEDMEDLIAVEEGRPSYNRFLGVARPDLYKRDALGSYRHIDGRGPALTDKEYEKLVARHKARENDPLSYIHFVHDFKTGNYVLPETGAWMTRDEYEKYVLAQTVSELQNDPDSFVHVDPNPRLDGSYVNRKTGEKLSLGAFQNLRNTEMARYGIPKDMADPIVMNDFSRRLKTSIATFGLSEPEGREIWGNTLMAASVLPSGGSTATAGAFLRGLATKQFAKRVAVDAGLSAGFQLVTPEGRDNLVNDPLRFLGDTAVDTVKFAAIHNGAVKGSLQAGAVDYVKSRLEGKSSYDATMDGMETAAMFAAIGGYGKLSSLPSSRLARYSMHAPVVGTMGYGIGRANGLFGGESTSYDGLTGTGPAPVVIPSYGSYNVNNNRVERVTLGR